MAKGDWIKYFAPLSSEKLIASAIETANWIKQYEHVSEDGKYWDVLPGKIVEEGSLLLKDTGIYGGSAGIALFFVRLYLSTKDLKWLEDAKAGVNYGICSYKGEKEFTGKEGALAGCEIGHLNGPTGGAYVAEILYNITGEEKYHEFFKTVTYDLIQSAKIVENGITWYGQYGIIAEGGLVLFLAHAYDILQDKKVLEAAQLAGKYIASQAEEAPAGGYRWYAMDTESFPTLGGGKGYFPGFFYGAAGSAYILAILYEITGDEEFLHLSKGGAEYILNIADVSKDGEAALVRYNDPLAKELYYLGMCQGPIGTSRLFYKLFEITGEEKYREFVIKLTEGILATGAPEQHSPGYWHTYCYCCGAAGMLEHFVSVYRFTDNRRYLEAAYRAAAVLIGDSYIHNHERRWYTSWNRHEPETSDAYIGLYHGSAGCAAALLALHAQLKNDKKLPGFLEDPYK